MEGVYERDGGFENWLRRGGLQTQDGYSVGSSAKWVVSSEEVIRGGYSRRGSPARAFESSERR